MNVRAFPLAREGGFTLVELLVATAITGIVTATLGFAVSGMLRSSVGARERVARAHDTTMIGFQFPNDVNAASAAVIPGTAACGIGTPVLTLTTTNVAGGAATTVWYGVDAGALLRSVCNGSSVASSTRLVDHVTAPVAQCQTWNAASTPAAFAAVGCASWPAVDRVTLTLTLPADPGPAGGSSDVARTLTLVGAPS